MTKEFEIRICEPKYFVGLEIERDREKKLLKIHQTIYIEKVLNKYGMTDAKPSATPFASGLKLSKEMCSQTKEDETKMKNVSYREVIGSLQYVVNVTRPDIAFAINVLSRYLNNPGQAHWKAVKQVLRYLRGTTSKGIMFDSNKIFSVCGYNDSDYAGCEDKRRSTTGYVFTICNGPVSWASRRQGIVALSTVEA